MGELMLTGFYPDMNEQSYHSQELLDEPALSYSIAKLLVTQTPMHAKYAHPLLGSKNAGKSTKAQDEGTLVHKLILGRGKDIFVMPEEFTDFRKKAAQDLALEQKSAGKIVVLQSAVDEYSQLVAAFGMQMKETEYANSFYDQECMSEVPMFWNDAQTGTLMQGMADRLNLKTPIIFDLKVTTDASTKTFEKKMYDSGYHIQNAFYRRGVGTIVPELMGRVRFVFLIIENEPPYALNIIEYAGLYEMLAELDADNAISIWAECMKSGKWPGYLHDGKANDAYPPTWVIRDRKLDQ
jgi:hypothetical protein